MAEIATRRIRRRCWRVLAPKWAHDPLSDEGATRHGGRYNEPGVAALYLSEDLMTAVAEYEQDLGIRPGTFCAYDVDVAGVADLNDPAVLASCSGAWDDLFRPWKEIVLVTRKRAPTWAITARLMDAGCAGARVPSTRRPDGVNLVLWRWNDAPDRSVRALDPQSDLPRDRNTRS